MTAIRVELELADGSFTTRMLHAGETVQQFTQNVVRATPALRGMAAAGLDVVRGLEQSDTAAKGFLSTLRDVAVVTSLVSLGISKILDVQHGWIGDIVKTNSEMERLNFQMRSMSQAADPIQDAANAVAFLRKEAMQVPFSLQTLNSGFVKLKSTGIDPLKGSMTALTDGVAAFGGSDEAFDRTILAISQMSGKGVIQMEELRQQLGESMPRAVELMARSMGVSMATLIKDISTGTVQSKAALGLFYAELERTYGGRAQLMMQTFEGQLKKTATSLQTLSITGGKGFFDEVKAQLTDVNDFLSSDAASKLGKDLGDALAYGVRALRSGIDTVIEFRGEITRFAIVAASAFGFKVAISGLTSFGNAIAATRTQLTAASFVWREAAAAANYFNITVNSGAPILVRTGAAIGTVTTLARGMMATFAAVAPWITVIGLGVYAAGEYFGFFSDKAKEAYDNLVQFGAETRRQAQEAISNRLDDLNNKIKNNQGLQDNFLVGDEDKKLLRQSMTELLKEKQDLIAQSNRLIAEAGEREDQSALVKLKRQIDTELMDKRAGYDQDAIAAQDHFDQLEKQAADAGKSIEQIQSDRSAALQALRIKEAQDEEQILRTWIDKEQELTKSKDAAVVAQARLALNDLRAQLNENLQTQTQLSSTLASVPTIPKALSDNKLFQNGQKALEKLQADVEGLRSSLQGADQDTAALQDLLSHGKYGDQDTQKVKELNAELVKAQQEKSALDVLMKGKNKLDDDIERARVKAIEDRVALEEKSTGRQLTESEKIKLKLESGYYDGFGPSSVVRDMLQGIVVSFDAQGTAATQVGQVLRENTFGAQSVARVDTMTDAMNRLVDAVHGLSGGLDGVSFDNLRAPLFSQFDAIPKAMSDKMSEAMKMFMDKGYSKNAAAGIVGNLVGESGLNPSSLTIDSNGLPSGGIANWNGTRLDDLKVFAARLGKSWQDLQTQVDFLDHELKTSESGAGGALNMASSPTAAADAFMRLFERPKSYASGPARANYAEKAAGSGPADLSAGLPVYAPDQGQIGLQEKIDQLTKDRLKTLADIGVQEEANKKAADQQAVVDAQKDLNAQLEATKADTDGVNKNFRATVDAIKKGKFGSGWADIDVANPKYAKLLEIAKETDRVENEINKKKATRTQLDSAEENFAQRQVDITNRVAEATARITDPLELKSTSAFRALRTELDKYLTDVQKYYGKDAAEYKAALDYKSQVLSQFHNMEVGEAAAGYAQDAITIRRSLMSQREQRTEAYREQLARIDNEIASFRGSEDAKVEIVKAAEAKKQAIREQYAEAMNPFIGQMKDWADYQTRISDQSVTWMDSLADGITQLADGTKSWADKSKALQDVLNGILQDLAGDALRFGFSQISGFGGNKAVGQTVSAFAGGGGLGKAVPVAHSGGVLGGDSLRARNVFFGAQRYHSGDIVNQLRPKLSPGEVPIIAKEGEGIFTPAQMSAMGGIGRAASYAVHNEVHVDGHGGSPEQNADLAQKMGDELDARMRAVFAEELINAQRPGNVLNTRGGR